MKTLKYLFIVALALFSLNACEDVPAPYTIPGTGNAGGGGGGTSEVAEGNGTLESPYNPVAANAFASALPADTNSDKAIYVKGIICSIKEAPNSQYGNASFYISADGSTASEQFYVYRCYNIGNKKFTDNDALNVGDEVIIYGKVTNYKGNTPETVQKEAYIYSLNEAGGDDNEPSTPLGNTYINETFKNGLGAFTTAQIVNEYAWKHDVNGYAKVSGYANGASQDAESWLISPVMNFANETAATIKFEYVINKGDASLAAANHKLMITDSYSGDFNTTYWDELDFGAENDGTWKFRKSGNISVPEKYMGKKAVVIAFKYTSTTSASSTWEVMNVVVTGEVGGSTEGGDNNEGGTETPDATEGDGTLENPYNPAAANAFASALPADTNSDKAIYVKGIISGIKEAPNSQYGNATFYISADGSTTGEQFYVYRCYNLGNNKFTDDDVLNVGDEVIICGKVVNYKGNTPETVQKEAYIYSLNGKTEGGNTEGDDNEGGTETPGATEGDGTLENPYNPAAANAFASALPADTNSDKAIYVKGIISGIKEAPNSQYGNATFYISADGSTTGEQFYVYRCYNLGNNKFTDDDVLKVGDEVIICGKVVNYKGNTPETVQKEAYIYSLNGKTENEGGSDDNTGNEGDEGNDEPETPSLPEGIMTVAQAISAFNSGTTGEVTISGYIVGTAKSVTGGFSGVFEAGSVATNIIIADSPSETDASKCIPVQLPSGSEIRTNVNLKDKPGNLGKKITLTGSLEKYFSKPGLKSPTAYTLE